WTSSGAWARSTASHSRSPPGSCSHTPGASRGRVAAAAGLPRPSPLLSGRHPSCVTARHLRPFPLPKSRGITPFLRRGDDTVAARVHQNRCVEPTPNCPACREIAVFPAFEAWHFDCPFRSEHLSSKAIRCGHRSDRSTSFPHVHGCMSLPPADRVPLVKQQFRVGGEQPGLCEERGYHGPFLNTEIYNTMPGWEGMGDCVTCGSTCRAKIGRAHV